MKAPPEHRIYLARKDYPLNCSEEIFNKDEVSFLKRYGFWIEALVEGKILPITNDQKNLIEVHIGKIEPVNKQEIVWRRLVERRIWEQNEIEAPHYKLVDESEQWFSRADWKKMRSWKNS
jgi:uncharacterized protein YifE (UPF0438 family)